MVISLRKKEKKGAHSSRFAPADVQGLPLFWHHLLMKSGVRLESRVTAGALELEKRQSRTLACSRSFFFFYSIQIHHMHSHIHTYTGTGFDSKICEFLKWHS